MSIWNTIYNIGVKKNDPLQLVRQKRVNNQITLFTTLTTFIFIPFLVAVENYFFLPFDAATTFLLAFTFIFNYFGWLQLAMFWRYFLVLGIVTFSGIEMPEAGFQYFLIPLGLIPFILSNNKIIQLVLFLNAIAFFFLRMGISENYEPHIQLSHNANNIAYIIVLSLTFALCSLFVIKFKVAGVKYEQIIQKQLFEIEEKRKDTLDSIKYAKRIQTALLPKPDEINKHLSDSFVFYKPKDIVSGDFYWFEKQKEKILIAVADCTGHGVPGAMLSVLCTNYLNKVVSELNITTPSLILDKVNALMKEQFTKNKEDVGDGMDISLCCIDTIKNTIEYAGAHNPFYLIRNSAVTIIKGDKQPIGKSFKTKPFTNHVLETKKGDCIFLFSDGYPDQFGGPRGKKFTYKQLQQSFLEYHHLPMDEQHLMYFSLFNDWKGKLQQVDDVCIIGIRL
ncbi:MAG: SpoIIE family protein phosphatase [Bacteroidia bacterium]|nr:SpoIIE family protein phosphatase [Bacteroidia bacterium]